VGQAVDKLVAEPVAGRPVEVVAVVVGAIRRRRGYRDHRRCRVPEAVRPPALLSRRATMRIAAAMAFALTKNVLI